MERARCEPIKDRVRSLQASVLADHGPDGLLLAAIEGLALEGDRPRTIPAARIPAAVHEYVFPEGEYTAENIRLAAAAEGIPPDGEFGLGDLRGVASRLELLAR